jgi:hypothetical protein
MVSQARATGGWVHSRQAAEPGGGEKSLTSLPNRAEQGTAPDRLQRPLRSRFRRQVSASGSATLCMGRS